ncbi:leucine-rich repeat protein [Tanacetum coccineum]|uniref:Leucine-rich repeat protein n=1 Tax=Tanacetum coccineum TaxID=301880 RepID=A0ABQ5A2P4_9ASTR
MLLVLSVFFSPKDWAEESDAAHAKFFVSESYHLTCTNNGKLTNTLETGYRSSVPFSQLLPVLYVYIQKEGVKLLTSWTIIPSIIGTIPHEVGRLSRLCILYLAENNFSGVIPTNLSGCSNLKEVYIHANMLAGSIPKEMSLLSKLAGLVIGDNKLTGGIPPFLGNITSMERFYATRNPLGGSIPDTLGHWKSLTAFGAGLCNLYGSIPPSIFNLSLLVNFCSSENHLTGSLPSEIGNQLPKLEWLQLWGNELTDVLQPSISNCSKLGCLEMADDIRFVDSLKNCSKLARLELNNCNLIGVLPSSIGNLVVLNTLVLRANRFKGKIPTTIGKLQKLQYLGLDGNQFSGPISNTIGNLSLLTKLFLYSNKLECHIPSSLGNCKELNGVALRYNRLTRKIPEQLLQLPSLTNFLDLRSNSLSGSIPSEVKDLKMLSYLDLSYNKLLRRIGVFQGIIPISILNLRGNQFQGIIPSSLSSLEGLGFFDISHNNLSGKIPQFYFGLARLLGKDINQNSSTRVKGTIGYAPPVWYWERYDKLWDIYSFGILLLEVMTRKKATNNMFYDGLSLHKFSYMALLDHVIDVIDDDAIVLQCTEANAKKVEECLAAIIRIGVSCFVDSPPQRMKIEIVVNELQRILDVLQNI